MDTTPTLVLENERVLLRPLAITDVPHLLSFSLEEPELWKFSSQAAHGGEEQLHNYISNALQARANGIEYPFIVFDKQVNAYAGSTRFYDIQPKNKNLQLGYTWYGKKFQRTGLNRHCKLLLLTHAFEIAGCKRVEFRADNTNARSIAAMKAIGCIEEGVLRQNVVRPDGSMRDSIVLSILREEWFAGVKEKLVSKTR